MVVSRYSNQGEKYIAVKRMTSPYYNWIVPQKHYHPSRAAERAYHDIRIAVLIVILLILLLIILIVIVVIVIIVIPL